MHVNVTIVYYREKRCLNNLPFVFRTEAGFNSIRGNIYRGAKNVVSHQLCKFSLKKMLEACNFLS
jgi:hypothetical protein